MKARNLDKGIAIAKLVGEAVATGHELADDLTAVLVHVACDDVVRFHRDHDHSSPRSIVPPAPTWRAKGGVA